MAPTMRADVVIPFHGRSDMVCRCLAALDRSADATLLTGRLLLVDDGSPSADAECVRRAAARFARPVDWIAIDRRSGFVSAVNLAWRRSSAPIAVVLNSDTVPPPNLLPRLTSAIAADPRLGAVGAASDNRCDLYQYRAIPASAHCDSPAVTDVPYLTAMCVAIRRAAVEGPLFDPVFSPGYFEDLDLSCRLRSRGWHLAVHEGCRVHHAGRATFAGEARLDRILARNLAAFEARWSHLPEHDELLGLLSGVGRHAGACA
jgi:GT2 family glycosyltransferase